MQKILSIIEQKKEEANKVFKDGDYTKAIVLYDNLLELDENNRLFNSVISGNKSLCYFKLNNHMEALRSINKSIAYNPGYIKVKK